MPAPLVGPVLLQVVGDTFVDSSRIASILWHGATSAGDICEIRCPRTNAVLWSARTPDLHTYLGVAFAGKGLGAPFGFRLTMVTAATTVLVYLVEL